VRLAAVLLVILAHIRRALFASDPAPRVEVPVMGTAGLSVERSDTLELLCWNIGYAGLGRESDFIADGGRHLRAESRAIVERNLEAITERLVAEAPDALLLQELSRDCYITHGVDVLGRVQEAMGGYELVFAPTIRLSHLPLVGNLEVGQGTFARDGISRAVRHALPSPRLRPRIRVQNFNALESRLRSANRNSEWVVFNVHLPAFDDGSLRRQQLTDVLGLLQAEYEAGRHVIAGGDWNLRLATTAFPYTTDEKSKSWVRDLPPDVTPPGWRWAVDATTPTNRTLEQPYRPGVNYRSVIDGFLVSPNVDVVGVTTLDLGFVNSDHNPVRLKVRRIPLGGHSPRPAWGAAQQEAANG
jgi:endonuclease/exonuclease/phosphatase family metal-dependent hydrolase